jgi:hypothetical protein
VEPTTTVSDDVRFYVECARKGDSPVAVATMIEALVRADESVKWRERLDEAEAYAKEGWDWLDAALKALGVESVFDIPGWKDGRV